MKYAQINLFFLFCFCAFQGLSTNYFVSSTIGNDNNDGLSQQSPFVTIQTAADLTAPGDTVFVMNGLYTTSADDYVAVLRNSGTPDNWIVLMALPGHTPKIEFDWWVAIGTEGASYIEIQGFEIEGNNDNITLAQAMSAANDGNNPIFAGTGISMDSGPDGTPSSFIRIINNTIYKCGGTGIGCVHGDYLHVEGNTIFECGWYSPYEESGISFYQLEDIDNNTGIKNIIRNNISHSNFNFIPDINSGLFTDGNGIIIDDSRNTQNNSQIPPYQGTTLIENNVLYNNGGGGLVIFKSDNIYAGNNTCYQNGQHPEMTSAEISTNYASNALIYNNILIPGPDERANFFNMVDGVDYDYNLIYDADIIAWQGANDVVGQDPLFKNATTNPDQADFRLTAGSPAIDAAFGDFSAATDILGVPRPQGMGYDIGAYEYDGISAIHEENKGAFVLYPNPSGDWISFQFQENTEIQEVQLFDSKGVLLRSLKGNPEVLDVSDLPGGIYEIGLLTKEEMHFQKLVKQ